MELITRFWYLQKKSKNLLHLFFIFPYYNISIYFIYKSELFNNWQISSLIFWSLIYLPMCLWIVFLQPFAYLQKENREKKDILNTLK